MCLCPIAYRPLIAMQIIAFLGSLLARQANHRGDIEQQIALLETTITATVSGGVSSPKTPSSLEEAKSKVQENGAASEYWSDSLQSVLDQPPSAFSRNLIVGGICFTVFVGAWSWWGTVEEVSFAQGEIAPQGDVYRVQSVVGGEVVRLYAEEGDFVTQGERIAEIDNELIHKEIERLEESLRSYELQLGQKQALIQQTQSELNILQAMTQADVAARRSSLMQEQATIATQEQMLAQYELDRQAQVGRMNRLEELVDRGAFAEDQLFQVEQSLRDRDRSITETQGGIQRSMAAIAQLEAELAQTQATAERQLLTAQEKLQQLQIAATELTAKINDAQILLDKSRTELSQTVLVAPVEGILSSLEIANEGEVLQPGNTLAEIAPDSAPLVLAAMLPSQEAGLVEAGMPVNVKFDAFPYQDYGVVEGTVTSISPDADINEATGATYQVEIALEQTSMQHQGKEVPLRAGQTATAEIIVSQRRIISLVLDPIRKLQNSNISL